MSPDVQEEFFYLDTKPEAQVDVAAIRDIDHTNTSILGLNANSSLSSKTLIDTNNNLPATVVTEFASLRVGNVSLTTENGIITNAEYISSNLFSNSINYSENLSPKASKTTKKSQKKNKNKKRNNRYSAASISCDSDIADDYLENISIDEDIDSLGLSDTDKYTMQRDFDMNNDGSIKALHYNSSKKYIDDNFDLIDLIYGDFNPNDLKIMSGSKTKKKLNQRELRSRQQKENKSKAQNGNKPNLRKDNKPNPEKTISKPINKKQDDYIRFAKSKQSKKIKTPKQNNTCENNSRDTNFGVIHNRIKGLVESPSIESLWLWPMNKRDRKIVHLLALEYKLKTKSIGTKDMRHPILTRTNDSSFPDDRKKLNSILDWANNSHLFEPSGSNLPNSYSNKLNKANTANKYNDKISKYMDKKPPKQQKPKYVAENVQSIGETNKGHQLLSKMGWTPGNPVGSSGDGICDPIQAEIRDPRRGLGS